MPGRTCYAALNFPPLFLAQVPGELDLEYYKNKVLRPVADQILQHLGSSFDEALGEARQLRLF